jgi:hypothetical protein
MRFIAQCKAGKFLMPAMCRYHTRFRRERKENKKTIKKELEKLCSLDFHFKEVKNRFKKPGL